MSDATYSVIGLMSGTSLDGLDIVHCILTRRNDQWHFSIEACETTAYDPDWKSNLKNSINLSGEQLLRLDKKYGTLLGKRVKDFIQKYNIKADLISSHGHTVFHQPEYQLTYQMGAAHPILSECQLPIINDFRSQDLALGGQGAPLVPIGDQLLFGQYDFCLNLGGIGNVSFDVAGSRKAFDVCPVNMAINAIVSERNLEYDKDGKLASTGEINHRLFDQLNALPFYQAPFPKSLGYEWFLKEVLPLISDSSICFEDRLYTVYQHIAFQLLQALHPFCGEETKKLLATGGGAHNTFLIQCIEKHFGQSIEVVVPDQEIIDFKEALVFALMGVLRLRGETNCLKSVTGAREDSCVGVLHPYIPTA